MRLNPWLWVLFLMVGTVCAGHARADVDLAERMARYKPPYVRPEGPVDPAIAFERVDVVIEPGEPDSLQTPFLSIGRDGSHLYVVEAVDPPGPQHRRGSSLNGRLTPQRLTELQRILDATQWLTAPGGAGPATHTHADRVTLAVTRDGKITTIELEGRRPAPYDALLTFINDLALQEHTYHRLRWPEERPQALRDLHQWVKSALQRPGAGELHHHIDFTRYEGLFAATPDGWPADRAEELILSIDLMVLLKRVDQAPAIARLRFDRDLHVSTAVARALPALIGEQAIPLLAEMSNDQARQSLIGLGAPAVPAIAAIIEPGTASNDHRSIKMTRAYLDHWDEVPQPIDRRIIEAVRQASERTSDRTWVKYYTELLEKAGATGVRQGN